MATRIREKAKIRKETADKRPDMLDHADLTEKERIFVTNYLKDNNIIKG